MIGPWLDLGFFNWYSTSKPLNSYGDLKGLKIRNSGGAGQAWRTQFMGAIPNTTPLPNVPLGLSQGTFDGLITTHETVASGQFWESGIRHALEDHQFIGEYIPIVSLAFWQKLSPDLQQVFTDLWRENISAYRANMAAAQARARDNGAGARHQDRRAVGGGARGDAAGDDGEAGTGRETVEDLARNARRGFGRLVAAG